MRSNIQTIIMVKITVTWQQINARITAIQSANYKKRFYGVPRGGSIIAGLLGNAVDDPRNADVIVDDIVDSGQTYKKWRAKYPNKPFITAFNRNEFARNAWIEFPWEAQETQKELSEQVNRLAIMLRGDLKTNVKLINNLINQIQNEQT